VKKLYGCLLALMLLSLIAIDFMVIGLEVSYTPIVIIILNKRNVTTSIDNKLILEFQSILDSNIKITMITRNGIPIMIFTAPVGYRIDVTIIKDIKIKSYKIVNVYEPKVNLKKLIFEELHRLLRANILGGLNEEDIDSISKIAEWGAIIAYVNGSWRQVTSHEYIRLTSLLEETSRIIIFISHITPRSILRALTTTEAITTATLPTIIPATTTATSITFTTPHTSIVTRTPEKTIEKLFRGSASITTTTEEGEIKVYEASIQEQLYKLLIACSLAIVTGFITYLGLKRHLT